MGNLAKRLRYTLREPLVSGLVRGSARLPLWLSQGLGAAAALASLPLARRARHISAINLRRCLPELTPSQQRRLLWRSFAESGKMLGEMGAVWLWPRQRLLQLVRDVRGEHHLRAAREQGRGVIIITPHLGNWEMAGLYLSAHHPITSLYRPHRIRGLDRIMRHGRERLGATLVPTDKGGVKQLLGALRRGELIGILPDQDPGYDSGRFAPLFGIPANTMTLASRLAAKSGAPVIACWAERLPAARGFRLHFSPTPATLGASELDPALAALNREVERLIRQCPQQYQWSYARFRRRPPGEPPFYD